MSFTLQVDGERWRSHLTRTVEAEPGLVPVAKGNGYGFGLGRLARRAAWLGVPTLAVGQYDELPEVSSRFAGDLVVLTPYRDFLDAEAAHLGEQRVIHTIGRHQDLTALANTGARVLIEARTTMLRHGFAAADLRSLRLPPGVRPEGISMHFPLGTGHRGAVEQVLHNVVAAQLPTRTMWVSHLSDADLATLRKQWPDFTFRTRVGTALWLGDRTALTVRATVTDAHQVGRGEAYGYRQRRAPRPGTILVVSGGTAHGIGLEAPTGDTSAKARIRSVARGGLDAAGWVRSPFLIGGKQPVFAEPPHMQASQLFIPSGQSVPEVGSEIGARVRFTTSSFDRVLID